MVKIDKCTRPNFCVDCDDPDCLLAGIVEADCPKWKCDNPTMDCERCGFIILHFPPHVKVSDTISRQAAIDAVMECYDNDELLMVYVRKPNELPTIQPEIIRCKDCEHGVLDDCFPHQYFCVFKGDEWNNADYFCGHAKRREVTE